MFKKERLTFLQIVLRCDNNIFTNLNSWQMWRKGGPASASCEDTGEVFMPHKDPEARCFRWPYNCDTYFLSPLKRFFNWSRSSLKILSQYFSKFYLFIQKNLLSDILNTAVRQSTENWANKIQNNGNSENKHFNNLAFD